MWTGCQAGGRGAPICGAPPRPSLPRTSRCALSCNGLTPGAPPPCSPVAQAVHWQLQNLFYLQTLSRKKHQKKKTKLSVIWHNPLMPKQQQGRRCLCLAVSSLWWWSYKLHKVLSWLSAAWTRSRGTATFCLLDYVWCECACSRCYII